MKCWPLLDCVRRGADLEQSLRPAALAYRVLAPHPDSVATRLSLHTLRLRKTPGRPWGHSPAPEWADLEYAVAVHRRYRLQCSSRNQVNGALRADDIAHETEGTREPETPRPRTHGHHAYATTGCGTKRRSSSSKTAYLLADMIGDLLHGRGPKPAGPRPTTITREERFAADVRLRGSRTAWRDKRRTPRPRPVAGPGRRSG